MQTRKARKPTISLRLPEDVLRDVDDLVERHRLPSRTALMERAIVEYVDELRSAKVVTLRPWTEPRARSAILRYLGRKPGTYVSDMADELGMELDLAFRIVRKLVEVGKLERAV